MAGAGAQWEGSLGKGRRRPARCFNGSLQRTVAQRSAWRVLEADESGARWPALDAWSRGGRREAERSGRALGGCCGKRREWASLSGQRREEMTHGAAAACVARGADVAVGRKRRREVAETAEQLSRARDASVRAPVQRCLILTSGPQYFFIY
jgi:hypothetical protein